MRAFCGMTDEQAKSTNSLHPVRTNNSINNNKPKMLKDGAKEFFHLYDNIFARFMTIWKKQILARVIRIKKENWG